MHSLAAFSHVVHTTSDHLLMGFNEEGTLDGGAVYRSTDNGSSWSEDARIAKQGNVRLLPRTDGSLDAFVNRTSAGPRTDRYRNFDPHHDA